MLQDASGKHGKGSKKLRRTPSFRFVDVVSAAVNAAKCNDGLEPSSSTPGAVLDSSSILEPKGQRYANLVRMYQALRDQHVEALKRRSEAEQAAKAESQAAAEVGWDGRQYGASLRTHTTR